MSIYIITIVEHPKSYEYPHSKDVTRPVGFFSKLEEAQNAVEENKTDYHECLYEFVVIERFEESAWTHSRDEWWYQWNSEKQSFIPCLKPECFKNITGFGMG